MERVLQVEPRPNLVGCAAAPFNPIFEGEIWGIFNPLRFLQWRADDSAAAAGNRRGAAALGCRFEYNSSSAGAGGLDCSGYPRTAAADDRHIGFQL